MSKLSRRGFLGATAGAGVSVAAASALGPLAGTAHAALGVASPGRASNNLGLQLFSVRNLISTLGFRAVFEELARIGYKEVEFAGYTSPASPGLTTADLRRLLDDNGLTAVGTHISLNNLLNAGARETEYARALQLGMKHVGSGSGFAGTTVSAITAEAARFNEAGAAAAAQGLKLYSHNHDLEFAFTDDDSTRRRIDVFLAATDPSYVFWELDILWAYAGARKFATAGGTIGVPLSNGGWGFDPADYVVRNPGRFPLFHTKDGNPTPSPAPTGRAYVPSEFGAGTIPFRTFFDKVGASAYHHPLWEQDNAPETPAAAGGALGAAARSYAGLHAVRTLTWLDELTQMVANFGGMGQISRGAEASLGNRLARATALVEAGSETRALGYVEQFMDRAQNQIKGDAADLAVRDTLLHNARALRAWLLEAEDRENGA